MENGKLWTNGSSNATGVGGEGQEERGIKFAANARLTIVETTLLVWCQSSFSIQQPLDRDTLSLKVYTDAAFANTPDLRSQLGFVVLLCDSTNRCNILHFSSYKARRVTRSVLGAEVYAFADGFDYGYALKTDLERMLVKNVPLTLLTDSKSLFDVIVKSSTTTEKRLMIDIAAVRDAYGTQEIRDVGHVRTDQNPADAFTKVGKCTALNSILESGRLDLEVDQWVVRTPLPADETCRNFDSAI